MYRIKEIFYSLQGEGFYSGRPSVFCRFSGCNLWSGIEEERVNAICKFCDTDFVGTKGSGGGRFNTADDLVNRIKGTWPEGDSLRAKPFIVCTGGEPLLQLDGILLTALRRAGFEIAVETNGTLPAPDGIDWICVSPKSNTKLVLSSGDELKLVYPQDGLDPKSFESMDFKYFYLQPMHGKNLAFNMRSTVHYCLEHPQWRLSLQIHKILDIR